MATNIDTKSWQPQQKQLWNALPAAKQAEVAQQGPEKAKSWVDQELARQIDLRGTVGAGKMTGRGDKLRSAPQQAPSANVDAGLQQELKQRMTAPMPRLSSTAQAGAGTGIGGGGDVSATRESLNLEQVGQGPAQEGRAIPRNRDGSFDLRGLAAMDQFDTDPTTVGDVARCSANSTVVALAVRGQGALRQGITNTRQAIEQKIRQAPDRAAAREAFAQELHTLDAVDNNIRNNNLSTNDLNSFASVLYQVHDSNKRDELMNYDDIGRMQESVGLITPGTYETLRSGGMETAEAITDPRGTQVGTARYTIGRDGQPQLDQAHTAFDDVAFAAARERVADETFAMLEPGSQATVGVFQGTGVDKPNHIVLVGKNEQGEMYVYNPIGDPNYFTGDAARDHLAERVGLNFGTLAVRDPGNRAAGFEHPLEAAVTFMSVNGAGQ